MSAGVHRRTPRELTARSKPLSPPPSPKRNLNKELNLLDPIPWPHRTAPLKQYCAEDERLSVLASFGMDALQGDDELARLAAFAAKLCKAPIALVSIVEEDRQRFLVHEGIDAQETPRDWSFCAHAMLGGETMIIPDAQEDDRFRDNPLVTGEPHIRFYAGAPLISHEGAPLGSLCVIDPQPRPEGLGAMQVEGLEVLALTATRRLESHRQASSAVRQLRASADRVQFVLDSVPDIAWSAAPGPEFDLFNAQWERVTGLPKPKTVDEWSAAIHPEEFDNSVSKFNAAVANASVFEDKWRLRQADGSYRWVLSRAVPSSDNPQTARWFGTLTDIDDTYRVAQEKDLLAGELAHRIKNIFSVITGLIKLHARGNDMVTPFADGLIEQVRALSRAQEFALQISDVSEDNLQDLLGVLMAPYGVPGKSAVTIAGDDVPTGKRAATPLALTVHELATNSAKYGALSRAEGRVSITVVRKEDSVRIDWCESGGPHAKPPEGEGFGSRLVAMSVGHQLGGAIEYDWRSEGLRVAIKLPLERLAE